MTDRCGTCPYIASSGCTFHVLGGNWHCARENLEGQNIVEVMTYTITEMEEKP